MSGKHNTIIAAAAKIELGPLNFRQKGRSRLWLADHGPWLNVVEFTPNRWSKGVSLMNAAHWLWTGSGFMSYNEAVPSSCHAEFESDEQFEKAAADIARMAAAKAKEVEARFPSFQAIAKFAVDRARDSERMRPSWWGYEAGIASGLLDRLDDAEFFLRGVTDERVVSHARPFLALLKQPRSFRDEVNGIVSRQRATLELPALEKAPF